MKGITTALWVSACILLVVACKKNAVPLTPGAPVGPSVGMVGESLSFLVVTTDPGSDSVRYRVDWGNALGDWTRMLASAESCTVGHSWPVVDTFEIRVQAEDPNGNASAWSADHLVSIESICKR